MFRKIKNFFSTKKVNPVDLYIITVTNLLVKIEHPTRRTEQIHWDDIDEIWLVNTADGPFLPDVWLALCGQDEGCLLPQGAKEFEDVYDIISKYKNFNFENFIASMSCTDNQRLILWRRDLKRVRKMLHR